MSDKNDIYKAVLISPEDAPKVIRELGIPFWRAHLGGYNGVCYWFIMVERQADMLWSVLTGLGYDVNVERVREHDDPPHYKFKGHKYWEKFLQERWRTDDK